MSRRQNGQSYSEDVKIDSDNLEECWLEQPSLMQYYTEQHADAIKNRDLAKIRIDNVYAHLDHKVRTTWKNYFDSKPTESAIKSWVLSSPHYKKAQRLLIDATRTMNILSGVKSSFDHRKKALESLVYLKVAGFHSEPSIKRREQRNGPKVINKRRRRKK